MLIKKAFRFRIKLEFDLEEKLIFFAGACRFVWNKFLILNRERLKDGHAIIRYYEMDFFSKLWKNSDEYGFLKQCPAHLIQQKLMDLNKAYRDCL